VTTTYDPKITAVLCIDFYNDFLSEGGKLWPWVKDMAKEVNLLDNLRTIVQPVSPASRSITCRTTAGNLATT
jgi:nicotinamidase-related amidase